MRNKGTDNSYYSWLCDLVGVNQKDRSYFLLVKDLYNKDFYWTVPNDDNRGFEGRALREEYCDELNIGYDCRSFRDEVSVLEVIIALAFRCESITEMPFRDWFWKIMGNVGLEKFTDNDYYDLKGPYIVSNVLVRLLDRTYHRTGRGGLFPLKRTNKDQRKVELWYQMNYYLVENYYTEEVVV